MDDERPGTFVLKLLQRGSGLRVSRRQHILEEVRKGLRQQPAWLAWHERKANIRSEAENSIADLIAD